VEGATSKLLVDPSMASHYERGTRFALTFARIEAHYFVNRGFLETEDQLCGKCRASVTSRR
jgi:proline iminopeptidase